MTVDLATNPAAWVVLAVAIALVPGVLLRLLLLAYPKGHPRRIELKAELLAIPPAKRIMWTLGHVETVWQEAPAARRDARPPRAKLATYTIQYNDTRLTFTVRPEDAPRVIESLYKERGWEYFGTAHLAATHGNVLKPRPRWYRRALRR